MTTEGSRLTPTRTLTTALVGILHHLCSQKLNVSAWRLSCFFAFVGYSKRIDVPYLKTTLSDLILDIRFNIKKDSILAWLNRQTISTTRGVLGMCFYSMLNSIDDEFTDWVIFVRTTEKRGGKKLKALSSIPECASPLRLIARLASLGSSPLHCQIKVSPLARRADGRAGSARWNNHVTNPP